MAGERYAKITIRAAWSSMSVLRGNQTQEVRFKLHGQWETYRRGGNPANNEFTVPAPSSTGNRSFVLDGVNNLLALLRATIQQRGLSYLVSAARDAGDDTTHAPEMSGLFLDLGPWPIVEFDITAGIYDRNYDLDFAAVWPSGWQVLSNATTILPVLATAHVYDAVVYGSATGSIYVSATSSNNGVYTYAWADGPTTPNRTNLVGPGTYTCTISDSSGASTTLAIAVGSDPRLDVLVQKNNNDVTLVVTGGVGPYTFAWADGPTTDTRPNLAAGTYTCTVTDTHGATVTVSVVIEAFNRFYFSRNPITLELAAASAGTKPNLRFLCEVWLETDYLSGVFTNIAGVLTQPADADGRTTFDVSTLLDAYVRPAFPAHGEHGLHRADPCFKRFYLQHSEQWDGSGAPTYTARETHYLLYGGLDFFEYAADSYFTRYRPQVHPFLTWEPGQKEVLVDQPEYLFYQHDSLTDGFFEVRVCFTPRTGVSSTVALASAIDAPCFSVWRVGVGLPQLRAALVQDVPPDTVAWQVFVVDSLGLPLTETRTYQLSEELPATRRYFLYANSVGGINTLACRGKAKTDLALASILVQRSLQPRYSADDGETFITSVTGVPTLTANTGYLTAEQQQAVQDFLLSEEIRYYDTDRYRPGTLQASDSIPLDDDDAGLLSLEFAFVLPTRRRYTPTLPLV